MTELRRLDDTDIAAHLAALDGWELDGDRIRRTFRFESFTHAFGWMSEIAIIAEKLNHHPEWSNVYNRVTVELTTHDVDGLSDLDFTLAARMDAAAARA